MGRRIGVFVAFAAFAASAAASPSARADVRHVVARGHTLEAIANRYHVAVKAIMQANHLTNPRHLRPGDVLVIPGVEPPKAKPAEAARKEPAKKDAKLVVKKPERRELERGAPKASARTAKAAKPAARETTTFAARPKTPGVLHVHRLATDERFVVRVRDDKGRVPKRALATFAAMMRSPSGDEHAVEPRLVTLLGKVSNHFGGRTIEVVSGFRPFTPTQHNPHSNHMHGRAIDFRVAGVPNEAVRDYCKTLEGVGCGYYPNSVFVHMDARDANAFWTDYAKPGEAPRYEGQGAGADEGATDVADEAHLATGATPGDAPADADDESAPPPPLPPPDADR